MLVFYASKPAEDVSALCRHEWGNRSDRGLHRSDSGAVLLQQAAKLRAAGFSGCEIERWAAKAEFVGGAGLRRRDFITLLGCTAAAWPLSAGGQTPARLGYLTAGTANSDYHRRTLAGLTQGLIQSGMIEGRDYLLETRFAEGEYARFPALARELQQVEVRIIIPTTIAAVRAAQQLSPPIPVVMPAINDPVGTGLIASLAHPGGLTTGVATLNEDVTPKLLEFLRVLAPDAARLAALYNPANPSNLNFLPVLRGECEARGIAVIEHPFKPSADWGSTLSTFVAEGHPDALLLVPDAFVYDQSDRIAALALDQHLPTLATGLEAAYGGALLAYGPSIAELNRRSAYYVKRILGGANPADLPVEQATRIGLEHFQNESP